MHFNNLKKFYFIDDFNKDHLKKVPINTSLIYRNYNHRIKEDLINKISKFCKSKNLKFFISNNVNLAIKLRLDGVYIPSFNKKLNTFKAKTKGLIILGSAHNIKELNEKKKQKTDLIFLAPVFKVKKKNSYLDIIKFNNLSKLNNYKSIALGGINSQNINKIKLLNCCGFGSISYIKEHMKKDNESKRNYKK